MKDLASIYLNTLVPSPKALLESLLALVRKDGPR